jgi:hypothetical protein
MFSDVDKHVRESIANARIIMDPYPHIWVENIFPDWYYADMLKYAMPTEYLKSLKELKRVGDGYPDGRKVMILTKDNVEVLPAECREFWATFTKWLTQGGFGNAIVHKFDKLILERFGKPVTITNEGIYVRDFTGYSLGPHTDAPHKVLTMLMYLPKPTDPPGIGTSIYKPKNPNFTCEGGPHHQFKDYDLVKTMPYRANCMFGFLKNNKSFHGVEPVNTMDIERNLIIYDARVKRTN